MTSLQLTKKIADAIYEKKGSEATLVELKKVSSVTDYFIICTADSNTQVKAIADNIERKLKDEGVRVWHKEGFAALQWVLLDYVDVVVHVFQAETRKFYSLEKLWGDAPIKQLEDPFLKKATAKKTDAPAKSKSDAPVKRKSKSTPSETVDAPVSGTADAPDSSPAAPKKSKSDAPVKRRTKKITEETTPDAPVSEKPAPKKRATKKKTEESE